MPAINILLVEPDPVISARLSALLNDSFYSVNVAPDGRTALELFSTGVYHLITVNRYLPDMNGCRLCILFREVSEEPSLLMLGPVGKHFLQDGYGAGADHYLSVPVDDREFLARVHAVVRRVIPAIQHPNRIRVGDIELDRDCRSVRKEGVAIAMTKSEFLLLEYMMRNQDRVVTREELSRSALRYDNDLSEHKVRVHMGNMRRKLSNGFRPPPIYTVTGKGYLLTTERQDIALLKTAIS